MTVKELIRLLQWLDEDLPVYTEDSDLDDQPVMEVSVEEPSGDDPRYVRLS